MSLTINAVTLTGGKRKTTCESDVNEMDCRITSETGFSSVSVRVDNSMWSKRVADLEQQLKQTCDMLWEVGRKQMEVTEERDNLRDELRTAKEALRVAAMSWGEHGSEAD